MKESTENFISIKIETEEPANEYQINDLGPDPLGGTGNEVNEIFYRVDDIVFAEPLKSVIKEDSIAGDSKQVESSEDISVAIGNVTVEKKVGRKNNKYHINIVDPANPVCPEPNCERKFATTTLLKAHIRKVHCADRSRYVCDRCGAGFPEGYLLRRHSAVHEMRRVQCHICHKMLSQRTNLADHLRSHSNTRPHECHICHKLFLRRSTLNVHVKFVHKQSEIDCDKCDLRIVFDV